MIFLDNSALEFREINEFLDKKNLDELGFFLVDTKAMSLEKIKKIVTDQVTVIDKNCFDKVKIFF